MARIAHSFAVSDKLVSNRVLVPMTGLDAADKRVVEAVQTTLPLGTGLGGPRDAFIAAVVNAYNHHLPLALDPDVIWLRIVQTVGIFVNLDPKAVRDCLVRHTDRVTLSVDGDRHGVVVGTGAQDPVAAAPAWAGVVAEIVEGITERAATPELMETLLQPFSGTTAVHRTALSCTLMHMFQSYFSYEVTTMCGIPRVTLYGTPEDYASIVARTQRLARTFPGLRWWFDDIIPVLTKISESAHGSPDPDWWSRAVSISSSSGEHSVSGWLASFVAFERDVEKRTWRRAIRRKNGGVDMQFMKPAVFEAPFTHTNLASGHKRPMVLLSGFLGLSQDPETRELRAVVGWAVLHQTPKRHVEELEEAEARKAGLLDRLFTR